MSPAFATLPANLPWHTGAYLLLDALAVPDLAPQISAFRPDISFERLYDGSELEALADLSPCLIALKGSDDTLLHHVLNNVERPWGYLLFGNVSLDTLAAHVRWLLFARWGTEQCFLRIADPVTAHHLFGSGVHLLGSIQAVCIPDRFLDCWHHHMQQADATAISHEQPFQLAEREQQALERARLQQCANLLTLHLRRYFPSAGQDIALRTRQLIEHADRLGVQNLQQLYLLTNLMAQYDQAQPDSVSEFPMLLADTPDIASAENLARQLILRTAPD